MNFDNTGGGTFQGTATLANSILRWATIRKTGTAANGSSNGFTFATVTGGALVPYTAATSSSFAWKGGNNTINYDITGPGNVTSSRDANSVRYLGTIDTIQNYSNTTLTLNALLNASANSLTLQRQSASSTATLAIGNSNELVLAAAAGPITIAMPITGTSGSVTKTGANTVTLSAANTYIGTTMVNEGTLTVTGSLDATSVEVKNSATLAGTGPLGGNVTVRTGGHQAFNVAATSGTQTARTINGSLTLEAGNIIDLSAAASPAPGGPYVLLTATGGIIGTPGSVTLNGLAGSVVKNGNNLELTVTAPAAFASWVATPGFGLAPEDQDPTDDPDNDGISNLMEYVLNGNPGASSTTSCPPPTTAIPPTSSSPSPAAKNPPGTPPRSSNTARISAAGRPSTSPALPARKSPSARPPSACNSSP